MPEIEYNGEPDDQVNGPGFEEETEVDEFAKYLSDDDDDEGGDDDAKKAKAEEDRLQALVDGKLAQRLGQERQDRDNEPVVREEPRQQQQQQQGPSLDETLDKMAKELTEDFAESPEKALKKMLSLNARIASDATATATARANKQSIDFYLSHKETTDPEFKEYGDALRKKIDAVPANVLAQYTPEGLRAALEQETDAAYGRMMRDKANKARGQKSSAVPAYGGGNAAPSSRSSRASAQFTTEEKRLIKMGESAKLSKKDIQELLDENRKNRGRN
jgi:hypothetical protein